MSRRVTYTIKPSYRGSHVQRWGDRLVRITGVIKNGHANAIGRHVEYDMTLEEAQQLLKNLTAALKEEEK